MQPYSGQACYLVGHWIPEVAALERQLAETKAQSEARWNVLEAHIEYVAKQDKQLAAMREDLARAQELQRREQRPEFYSVLGERIRQDKKWGQQNHDDWKWLAILMEEVGEAAQAMMQAFEEHGDPERVHKEVLEATAVGLAWLECIRRRKAAGG